MWTIKRIDEADFGCEERLPGEPLMVLVSLESDDGRVIQFEAADNWLTVQELSEGDEWPEDIETPDAADERTLPFCIMCSYLHLIYICKYGRVLTTSNIWTV